MDPSSRHEEDFHDVVKALLGDEALMSLKRLTAVQDSGLCHEDRDVIEQCESISGIPYRAEEAARHATREAAYRRKFGPLRLPGGIGIVPDRIRLDYVREHYGRRGVNQGG